MYAYAKVIIERPNVWTMPLSALMHLGDRTILKVGEKTFCWIYKDGLAHRLELQTGVTSDPDPASGDQWIEVNNYRFAGSQATPTAELPWTPIDGTEQVILGDLSILAEGDPVKIAPEPDRKPAPKAPPGRAAKVPTKQ